MTVVNTNNATTGNQILGTMTLASNGLNVVKRSAEVDNILIAATSGELVGEFAEERYYTGDSDTDT